MASTLEKALGVAKSQGVERIYVSHVTVRQSISLLVIKLILIDVISAIIFLISNSLLLGTNVGFYLNFNPSTYNTFIFLVLASCKIALTVYLVLEWVNEYYEITPSSVIHKRGILLRSVKKQDLALIRLIRIQHGLFGKILNFGTINLYDIRLNKEIGLYLIHNPLKYLKIFEDIIPDLEEEKSFFREKKLEGEDEI